MSGDVQPRKRKDKKKRKDEDGYSGLNEDVNIHVHKEGGTGGNICAKIVFFFLFSALIVLIGLIIKENQGLTELDEYGSESRYSQIFEGWVDKSPDEHEDDHSPELSHEHDDHDLEEEEADEHYESEEDKVEETEEEQSEEADNDDDQEEDEDSTTRSEEETNEETEEEDQVPESDEDNTVEEDNSQDVDDQSVFEEEDKDDTEEEDDNVSEVDKYDDDTEEVDKSREQSKEEKDKDENSNEDEVAEKSVEDEKATASEEITKDVEEESQEAQDKKETLKELLTEKKQEEEVKDEPTNPSSSMATKIGVGVALLAVAYNVFFRKRSPEKPLSRTISEKEPTPDLSRRNTIVPPLSLQEVEPDLPEIEDQEEEYSDEEYSDEDSRSEHRSAREEYEELSSNYARLTPEGNLDAKNENPEEEILEHDIDIEEEELEEEELEDEEIEDIEDDYEKYDEDEDEELLKRLEAKYGKLGRDVNVGEILESDSDKEDYEHSNITSKDDYKIKDDIDAAQEHLDKNAAYANKKFEALLEKYPLSPRSLYGKAKALDILAEENQSNELLQEALNYYMKALNAPNVPNPLFVSLAERYIDRSRFIGRYKKAVAAHWRLIERFPDNPTYLNNLAVTYLTTNLVEEARSVLKRVLSKWPNDGFAMVHYGFILKTADNNLEESVSYITKGLKTKKPGVIDGRFYFHLGDALTRLNRNEEAMKLYEEGVQEKVFLSKYQRSLYNIPRLTAKPWWEPADLPSYKQLFQSLKDNWHKIRKEGLSALNELGYFRDEAENLKDTGTWKQLELFARGQKFAKNCAKNPVTCSVIQSSPDARGCRRGQTKFSVMHPGTHVWPHCGPTNCRLRIHLGLKVPPNTFIRVAEEIRSWKEGDIIIFDDSFEHEVWHNGSDFRLVLIVDIWHPELTPSEKKSLSSI